MNQNTQIAALLLRLALGTMFVAHGLLKVMVFTLPGTVGFFEQVGFPGWLAYIVTFAEIGGGVLLLAGVAVPAVSIALLPVLLYLYLATRGTPDQLADYAARKGWSIDEAEQHLAPILDGS